MSWWDTRTDALSFDRSSQSLALRACQAPRHPPRRPGERVVRHGGKPGLILPQGEQQMRLAITAR
jgi:hypothetical protein